MTRPVFCAHCAGAFRSNERPALVESLPWHRRCAWWRLLELLDEALDPLGAGMREARR